MEKNTEFKAVFEVTPALNENEKLFFNNFNNARTDNNVANFKSNWKATPEGKIEWEGNAPIALSKDKGQEMIALTLKEMCLLKAMEEEKGLTIPNYQVKDLTGNIFAKDPKTKDVLKIELDKDTFHFSQGKLKEDKSLSEIISNEKELNLSEKIKFNYEEILFYILKNR